MDELRELACCVTWDRANFYLIKTAKHRNHKTKQKKNRWFFEEEGTEPPDCSWCQNQSQQRRTPAPGRAVWGTVAALHLLRDFLLHQPANWFFRLPALHGVKTLPSVLGSLVWKQIPKSATDMFSKNMSFPVKHISLFSSQSTNILKPRKDVLYC